MRVGESSCYTTCSYFGTSSLRGGILIDERPANLWKGRILRRPEALCGPTDRECFNISGPMTREPYLGGSQNYGPFLGTLNIRCRIIIGTQ